MYRTCYIVQIVTFEIKEQDLPRVLSLYLEFNLQLKIPKCALKGLELMDVIFNDPDNCNMITGDDGRFFTWTIDYNDCGTVKNVRITNNLKQRV